MVCRPQMGALLQLEVAAALRVSSAAWHDLRKLLVVPRSCGANQKWIWCPESGFRILGGSTNFGSFSGNVALS